MLAIPSTRSATALAAAAVALVCSCAPASTTPAPEELSSHQAAVGGPDLWVQSVVAPASALPSSAVQVTVTVCNQGDSSGNAPVWIFRSTDAVITLADVQIGSSTAIGSLLPGACNTAVVTANIPSQTGTFYLGAFTDPSNVLVEPNEANNAAASPKTTVVGSKPDFIITSASGPAAVLQNASFSVATTLCNQGTQPATTPVGIYVSTDANITTSDTFVGQLAAPPSLAPGACATLTGTVTAPNNPNAYWLGAIADRTNTVSELLETNNAFAGNQIGVGSKPDFIVTAVSGPPSAQAGAPFPVTTTMCNQGTQSGTAPVTLYLSTDATITTTDLQVAQLAAPPSLAPGACATLAGSASSTATGAYWLGAIANANLAVAELIKTNDAKTGNRMGVGDAPDFFVTSVTTAPASMPGAPIALTATVCNQGTQAGNATVGVVFSYDDTITTSDWLAGVLPTSPYLKPGACDVVSGTLSAPSITGFHYAGVIADYYGTTTELLEDNNVKAGTRVAVGNGPDLAVTSVSTAPSALPGSQVTVTATTCNQGTQGAVATSAVYFSTDATITTADLWAGDFPASTYLLPGECDTESMSVWTPATGLYTVGAIADRFGSLLELWETNNATAGNLIAVGNGPDFVLTSVSSAASAQPGGSLQVTATLCNQGTLGAGAPQVEAFFSTDATITAADLLAGAFPPGPFLNAGACTTLIGFFPAPTSGTYYAGAIADRLGSVAELVETNNAAAGTRFVVGNGPDLVVTALSAGATVSPGYQLTVAATVCNQGTQGTYGPLQLYFSTDTFISLNDLFAGSLSAPWLDAGACATVTGSILAPGTSGTYFLGAIADDGNGIVELAEDNNTFTGPRVGVGNAPDFYVKAVSAPPSVTPGAQVTVTTTVCNQGTQPSSVPVAVYFSSDATITTSDLFAGLLPPFNYLPPGSCEVLTGTFPAPPQGTYRVGAIADAFNSTPDLFEDNNWLAGNLVAVGNGPDFYVKAVSTAPSALPGAQVTLTATLCNQGTLPGSSELDFFFSSDATITTSDQMVGGFPPMTMLDPGACTTLSVNAGAPAIGTYFVGAIADPFNSMPELVESNNWKAGNQLAVGNGPDFVVTSVVSAPSATPGSGAQVTATLCNLGTQGAWPPIVEAFFSSDATITSADFFGGPMFPPPPYLNPGECGTLTSIETVPPQPGIYYAGAIVDRYGGVPELREDNNATAGNQIGVDYAPDFSVASVSTAVTAAPGTMVEVAVKVCNQGTQSAGAPLEIYFSTDDSISINDTYSTNLPMPYLDPGACSTVVGNALVPGNAGTYYVGAIVNAFGSNELFKDNNALAGNRIGVGNLPDFYLQSVSTAPSATPGSQLTVKTKVCNQGTQPAGAPVAVYFSTDATITNADLFAGMLPPFPYILPGGCEVLTGTFPAPPQGSYWVGAIADNGNTTPELFEDNNWLAGNQVGVGNAPDFYVKAVSTAPSAMPGAQVTLTATLCNQGNLPGSSELDFFFSSDATITTSDQMVWGFPPMTMLDPGACTTLSGNVSAPPFGTYFVGAIADAFNAMPELVESNNWKAGNQLVVGSGPDFVITSVVSAPSATPGSGVQMSATLCNQGTQGAWPPIVEAFFSRDATITGEDFFAGPMYPPPPYLNPGECGTLTSTETVPPTPGIYYAGAIVDRYEGVPELREDNNATAGNQIGVDYMPDFYVASVSTKVTAAPGTMVEVEIKVCNQGTQSAGAPLEVYFSTDDFISINDTYSTNLPLPYLDPGACSTVVGNALVPGTPGTYYVGAIVNAYGPNELFKDNNALAGNQIGVGNLPDFYLQSVSTASSVLPGGQLTVKTKVCNQGTQPAGAPVAVYFSTDATIDQSDLFAGLLPPFPYILPGGCEVLTGTFPAPPQGAYWVGAIADNGNTTPELFEDNNWLAGNRVGVGYGVDFVVSSVSTAPSAMPGAQVTLTATLCNQGTFPGSSELDFFFSSDATITTSDQMVWGFPPMTMLDPGACTTLSGNVPAPPFGTYFVGAIADAFNAMPELVEDNNWKAGNQLVVGSGPDFVITSVTSAPSATPGSGVQMSATLCNEGTQGAWPPIVEAFFSRDANITGEDFFAGPMYPPPPFLDAGECATLTSTETVPPTPGIYYAGAIVDRYGGVPELREDNNATAGNQIGVDYMPDFYLASVSTAVTAAPGTMVEVEIKVCNQGTQSAGAPLEIYFSTDDYISINDTYSTNVPMPYLDPGACATVVGNALTPGVPGTYYVGAIVNAFGPNELFKDNNALAGNRIGVGNMPDFYVQSVSTAASVQPGGQLTVKTKVCNQGTQPAGAPVAVYFSTDATIDQSDLFAGLLPPFPYILPGGCEVLTGTFPAPPQGAYWVGAIADNGNTTLELYEDNNALAGNQFGVGYAPDFIISSVSTAPSAMPGAQVTFTATLCNQGTLPGSSEADFFFSSDATITTSDQIVWGFPPMTMLDPGACTTLSANVPAPPPGTYWVGAIADAFGSMNELIESNNAKAGNQLVVGNGPDFVVTSVTSAPSATPGSGAQVSATLCNEGTQGAWPPIVEAFFSRDATITSEDFFGGPMFPPPPYLNPGECATLTSTETVPPTPGIYYAGAIVDRYGGVPELREDNNATTGNRIGVEYMPDFYVASVSTSVTAAPGTMVEVEIKVCNQGTQSAGGPLEVYFSTDDFISINDTYSTNVPMPYLDPGACSTVVGNALTPGVPGTYYVGAIANAFGPNELFKDNNALAGNQIGVGNAPDFYLESVSTAASAQPGSQLTVKTKICNRGTQPAGAPVAVYFSTDATITNTDFFAGLLPPFAYILPGGCEVLTGTFPAPPQGAYWVGAIADNGNSTPELFEDNNWLAGNRVGVGSGPDFTISSVSTAPSVLPGAQVAMAVTLCNQGTLSGSSSVDLFFSADATITSSDQIVWGFPPSTTLDPGACTTLSANVPAPPPGTYWVGAIADTFGSMYELLEDNNWKAGNQLVVGDGPDFVVTSVVSAPSATPGSGAQMTATLCNRGTQGAYPPIVEGFFSRDATITGDDFFAGPMYPPPPYLNPGECATLTSTESAPPQLGIYYAGAIVDRYGGVPELREDNNATAGNRIGVDYVPDFYIASVSTTATSAAPGTQIPVTVIACNQGTQSAGAPLEIYFSTDDFISINDTYSTNLPLPYLDPGTCTTVNGTVWTPWSPGTYFVGAIVNSFGGNELFKDNNAAASPTALPVGP